MCFAVQERSVAALSVLSERTGGARSNSIDLSGQLLRNSPGLVEEENAEHTYDANGCAQHVCAQHV